MFKNIVKYLSDKGLIAWTYKEFKKPIIKYKHSSWEMDEGLELTFLRRNKNGQQMLEKKFSFTSHWENADWNHNIQVKVDIIKKNKQLLMLVMMWRKG